MNITHRYFVQYMLKNGISTVDDAFDYCKYVSQGKIDNLTHFKYLIIETNREISKQFFKIVFSVCEVTNQNIVVWLNTKNDDISKHQISYSAMELEYFHAILQEILNSEEHQITFIVCINITSTLTSQFSRDSGQKVLNKWLQGGYYVKRGDYIHLGPRTILEFTAYLRSNCPESICSLCSELVFTGQKCSHCGKVLHAHCLSTYLSNQSICPCCQNDWIRADGEVINNYMQTMDTNENGILSTDDETTTLHTFTQPGHVSPILSANKSRRNQRTWHSEENQMNNVDESGPSSRKRHR